MEPVNKHVKATVAVNQSDFEQPVKQQINFRPFVSLTKCLFLFYFLFSFNAVLLAQKQSVSLDAQQEKRTSILLDLAASND